MKFTIYLSKQAKIDFNALFINFEFFKIKDDVIFIYQLRKDIWSDFIDSLTVPVDVFIELVLDYHQIPFNIQSFCAPENNFNYCCHRTLIDLSNNNI